MTSLAAKVLRRSTIAQPLQLCNWSPIFNQEGSINYSVIMKLLLVPIVTVLLVGCLSFILGAQFPNDLSKKFREKGCAKGKPAKNLDPSWIAKIAAWFVPMASQYHYHRWAERLTNFSLDEGHMASLCLKMLFLASEKPKDPYLVVVGGQRKATLMKCKTTGPNSQECDGVLSAPDYKPGVDSKDTIVATDNENYLVMLSCVRNKYKSWMVMTPKPSLSSADIKGIIKVIAKYGFKRENGVRLPYDQCPKSVLNTKQAVEGRKGQNLEAAILSKVDVLEKL